MKLIKQFLLTKHNIIPVFGGNWNKFQIDDYTLYCDTDLEVCQAENESRKVFILGNLFDYEKYNSSNSDILESVLKQNCSFEDFLFSFDKYSGNFLVFTFEKAGKEIKILTDNAGLRELYYQHSHKTNTAVAASQPVAIAKLLGQEENKEEDAIAFYSSPHFKKRRVFVGDTTNYANIYRLKANYYLNFLSGQVIRYFPKKVLTKGDFETQAAKAAIMIRGYLHAANHRKKLAIPVSAGWESRILLAASKEIAPESLYFVFKHSHFSDNHQDIKTPKRLFEKLGLEFNILEYSKHIDAGKKAEIEAIYSFPRLSNFAYIINVYGKMMNDRFILNGNVSEIARTQFDDIKVADSSRIAFLEGYPFYKYALDQYKKWLENSQETFKKYKYRNADMLYWEENSTNWTSKTCSEVRFVSELYQPFNSRELLLTMMSVDIKYRWKQNPILYKRIIEILWPECLLVPVNPDPKKQLIGLFQKLGLYSFYREIHLKISMNKAKAIMRLKR